MNLASHAVCFLLDLCKAKAKFLRLSKQSFSDQASSKSEAAAQEQELCTYWWFSVVCVHFPAPALWHVLGVCQNVVPPHPAWWLQRGSCVPQGHVWEWKSFSSQEHSSVWGRGWCLRSALMMAWIKVVFLQDISVHSWVNHKCWVWLVSRSDKLSVLRTFLVVKFNEL